MRDIKNLSFLKVECSKNIKFKITYFVSLINPLCVPTELFLPVYSSFRWISQIMTYLKFKRNKNKEKFDLKALLYKRCNNERISIFVPSYVSNTAQQFVVNDAINIITHLKKCGLRKRRKLIHNASFNQKILETLRFCQYYF